MSEALMQALAAEDYQTAVLLASIEGSIILKGANAPIVVKAAQETYNYKDLLIGDPIHQAKYAPSWIEYDAERRFIRCDEESLCYALINRRNLTIKRGRFYSAGQHVQKPEIKKQLERSLAIVYKEAGKKIYSAMQRLEALCPDETPDEPQTSRLTIKALADEMKQRGYGIRLNKITMRQEPIGRTETGRAMKVKDLRTVLHDALSDDYKGVTHETLAQYISFLAEENAYNPVLELLEKTEWDRKDRFEQLYKIIGIDRDDSLSKALVQKWLYMSIALLFNDDAEPFGADGVLVLVGPQGMGKTSLVRHLAMKPEWFGEGMRLSDFDKDYMRRALNTWICELGEVESTFKKSDIDNLKNFITTPRDQYRLPYESTDIEAVRHTALCATCNSDRYLIDQTGNRRWWTVPFRTEYLPREELEALDALQLWAQIYVVVRDMSYEEKRTCFRLSPTEQQALAHRNGEHEAPVKAQPEVEDILSQWKTDDLLAKEMTISQFKEVWIDRLRNYTTQQISAALKRCGIVTRHTKYGSLAELPVKAKAENPFYGAS